MDNVIRLSRERSLSKDLIESLDRTKDLQVKRSTKNLYKIISEDAFVDLVRFDEMAICSTIRGAPVSDEDALLIKHHIVHNYGPSYSLSAIHEAIDTIAALNPVHPIIQRVEAITHDGKSRVGKMLVDYFGAPNNEYTRAVSSVLMRGAVARIYEPGIKFDYMVILEGIQGTGKSTALRHLALESRWFIDNEIDFKDTQKAWETIGGAWIVEIAELQGFNKTDVRHLKSYLSRQADKFRPAFGHRTGILPRQCIFVGTTNDKEYLRDATGNRRYLPVETGEIDIEGLKRDAEQLWAEALVLWRADKCLWLNGEMMEMASSEQDHRTAEDSWVEPISEYLENPGIASVTIMAVAMEALLMEVGKVNRGDEIRIGTILGGLGWVKKRQSVNSRRISVYHRND